MKSLEKTLREMVRISDSELKEFLSRLKTISINKHTLVCKPGTYAKEVYYVNSGLLRVFVTDAGGVEHTIHFAMPHTFVSEYSSFLTQTPSSYSIEALQQSEVVVMPREAIEWGYEHIHSGNEIGRLIAEYYYVFQDNRIKSLFTQTPKQRYDNLINIYSNIHNLVPQHMIASYLGITAVHLSRIKRNARVRRGIQ